MQAGATLHDAIALPAWTGLAGRGLAAAHDGMCVCACVRVCMLTGGKEGAEAINCKWGSDVTRKKGTYFLSPSRLLAIHHHQHHLISIKPVIERSSEREKKEAPPRNAS